MLANSEPFQLCNMRKRGHIFESHKKTNATIKQAIHFVEKFLSDITMTNISIIKDRENGDFC